MFLTWTEPRGKNAFYRVQWAGGNVSKTLNVTQTHTDVTNLTAGVQYKLTVTAVADDGLTEGQSTAVSVYTSKLPQSCTCILDLGSGSGPLLMMMVPIPFYT